MVRDLNVPVEIRGCPLVRESDGLTTSSRNAYLSADERQRALVLHRALAGARKRIADGERDTERIADEVRRQIADTGGVNLEYVAVVDPDSLEDLTEIGNQVLVAVAARVGSARLIDNVLLRGLGGAAVKDGRKHVD